jgi:hypothetical protein
MSIIHDVRLAYSLRDHASVGLNGIARSANQAAGAVSGLGLGVRGLAASIGGIAVMSKAKDVFIGFNSEIENSKISIAAVSQMFNGGTFAGAMKEAEGVFSVYQEAAKASTATTKEFLEMHKMIAPVMTQSGASMSGLMDVVKGATVAAPIFGVRPDMLANDLRAMLQGAVTNRDLSANIMVSSLGLDRETFNKKARANVGFAMETIQKALGSPAIKEAAKAFEGSFAGVTSTLEDTLQILAGQAGQPVFKAITEEVRSINDWLTKNKAIVEAIAKDVGEGLVTGFKSVREAVGWISAHSSEIKLLAEALILLKGVGIVGGAISGGITSLSPSIGALSTAAGSAGTGLVGLTNAATPVVAALGVFALALQALADYVDGFHKKRGVEEGDRLAVAEQLRKSKTPGEAFQTSFTYARQFGAIGADGKLDKEGFRRGLNNMGFGAAEQANLVTIAAAAWDRADPYLIAQRMGKTARLEPTPQPDPLKKASRLKASDINVNIQRVEVSSEDPDRFVVGLADIADKAAHRSGQARSAIPLR